MRHWARLHGQAAAAALARIAAQPLATLVAVLVIAVAIALPVMAAVVLRSLSTATAGLDTDPHVNVYLALDATEEEARKLEPRLRAHPDSAAVRFVSRAQAMEELKATTHLAELLASLERNPLPHAFSVRTRTADPARLEALRADWQRLPKVDQVVADFEWSQRLARWVRFGDRALAAVGLFLALAVVLIVGHLIRLQVVTRRGEIEVSQLVGATADDVRRPFLYHGILQGLLAGAAAIALAALVSAWLGYELQALTSTYATEFKVVFLDAEWSLTIALASALLGWLGAWLSVGRELKRFAQAS